MHLYQCDRVTDFCSNRQFHAHNLQTKIQKSDLSFCLLASHFLRLQMAGKPVLGKGGGGGKTLNISSENTISETSCTTHSMEKIKK